MPLATLSPELQDFNVPANYELKILFHNFNDRQCKPTTMQVNGWSPQVHQQVNATKYENATCIVLLTCKSCLLTGQQQSIALAYDSPFAFASNIEYYLSVPHFVNGSVFIAYENLAPEGNDLVFKGAQPSIVSISLTKSLHTKLATDYLIQNLVTRSTIKDRTSFGYVAARYPTSLGSICNETNFNANNGLALQFAFTVESSVLRIEQTARSSLLDYLSKIAALIGGVSSLVVLIMTLIEFVHVSIRNKREKAEQQNDVEMRPLNEFDEVGKIIFST